MKALQKMFTFIKSQLEQVIKDGGVRVLYGKIKKAGRLLFVSVFAPIAVYLGVDWVEAYDFMSKKTLSKMRKLRLQSNVDKALIERLSENAVRFLKKAVDKDPDLSGLQDWIRGNKLLENLYLANGQMAQCDDIHKRVGEIQQNMARKHHLDDLGLVFIPGVLPIGSVGVYENLDIYIKAGILGMHQNKKMILLLDPDAPVNNAYYLNCWRKYITIVSDPMLIEALSPLEKCLTVPLIWFMPLDEKIYRSSLTLGIVREKWIKENRAPILTLPHEDVERGWNCLRSLGLPEGAWFVSLHVREAGWRDGGSREEDFRNSDITTYIPAIKVITDAGGWVLRIGDSGMSKLPDLPQVIDYAHSDIKSDWMDVFLCSQCRFIIGTASGMYNISLAYGVPVVMTNLLPAYAAYLLSSKDLFIPRLCWSKEKGRHLSFEELMSPPVSMGIAQSYFDNRNIQIIKNKAEEIKDLVEEMLQRNDGAFSCSEDDEVSQRKFQEITTRCGKLYGDSTLAMNARIGRKFLHEYAELLPAHVEEGSYCENKR